MIDPLNSTSLATTLVRSSASATAQAAAGPKDSAKVRTTAQQFEALLIGQLLKTSREAGSSGWLGTGDNDEAGQIGVEMGEQEFARMLAAGGGLGLSKTIEAAMRADVAKEPK